MYEIQVQQCNKCLQFSTVLFRDHHICQRCGTKQAIASPITDEEKRLNAVLSRTGINNDYVQPMLSRIADGDYFRR